MTYLNGPGKSAFIVFVIMFLRWPLNTELNNLTKIIKHMQRHSNEHINKIKPIPHSGKSTDSNKKLP